MEYAPDAVVGDLTGVDPDTGSVLTFTLVGGDTSWFTIAGDALVVGSAGLRRSEAQTRT